jgi:hypothetical protein
MAVRTATMARDILGIHAAGPLPLNDVRNPTLYLLLWLFVSCGNEYKAAMESLQEENQILTDASQSLMLTNKSLTDANKSLTDANKSLTDANKSLTDTNKSITDANKSIKREADKTNGELNSSLSDLNSRFSDSRAALGEKIEALENQLREVRQGKANAATVEYVMTKFINQFQQDFCGSNALEKLMMANLACEAWEPNPRTGAYGHSVRLADTLNYAQKWLPSNEFKLLRANLDTSKKFWISGYTLEIID